MILGEDIPPGILRDEALLQPPPAPIPVTQILSSNLPDAWSGGVTTPLNILNALSRKAGKTLPWVIVREALEAAIRARLLEKSLDSGPWPCELSTAQNVTFHMPKVAPPPQSPPPPPPRGLKIAEADLQPSEIQDFAEVVGSLAGAAVGYPLTFRLRVELGPAAELPDGVVAKINEILGSATTKLKLE